MQMQHLTPESEQRLLRTLDQISEYTESGSEPNEAIAKAATAERIPVGHVPLLVQAYNTGRTAIQRQTGKTAAERAAKFPLADRDEIVRRMYPQEKSASVTYQEQGVSQDFQRPPTTKTAYSFSARLRSRMESLPEPAEKAVHRSYCKVAALRRQVEEFRRETSEAHDKLLSALGTFAELYKQASPRLRGEILTNLPILHGGVGTKLLNYAAVRCGNLKVAASVGTPGAAGPVYDAAVRCKLAGERLLRARQKFAEVARSTDQEVEQLLRPFASENLLTGLSSPKTAALGVGGYALGAGMSMGAYDFLKNMAGSVPMLPTDNAKQLSDQVLELEDPSHQAELRRIQSEAMLNDLMANDEVISTKDPEEVVSAYNELAQAFPRAAHQGMLVRSLLRSRLTQGSLGQFELGDLMNTEGKLRTLAEPAGFRGEDYGTILPRPQPKTEVKRGPSK